MIKIPLPYLLDDELEEILILCFGKYGNCRLMNQALLLTFR